ncbi:MAG: amidohydrolase family protein [Planctomycetes bacterium]|nr:amidohydrolase family protein [Planctomycetota bacterium]
MILIQRLLTCCFFAALALPVHAVPFQDEGGDAKKDEKQDDKKDDKKDDDKKPEDRWFAVVGGDVYTGTGAVLRGATVLSKNGKIEKIDFDVYMPPETKTLDATGYRVYPGLVAISSQGLLGNSGGDFEDTIDPFNSRMILGLATGITTTGSGSSAVKLKRFSVDDMVINDKIFSIFSWSNRSPRGKYDLREKFKNTSEYLRQYREWEKKVKDQKDLAEPSKKNVDGSCLSVLKGETTAKFVNNDADELLGIARLAQEFGFRPVIEGAQEAWTVADELGRAGARVILTPRDRRPKSELQAREGGTSIENAAILHRAGIPIAIVPSTEGVDLGGIAGRDIIHLPIEVGFAVRGGLPEQAALESITITPARIMGVSHRVGTLEVGKDCDLIVTDGDVLHYKSFVQYAVVDGKQVYDKERELFYAQIRPRPVAAEAKKVDKGETAPVKVDPAADAEKKDGEKKDDEGKDEEKKDDEKKDG